MTEVSMAPQQYVVVEEEKNLGPTFPNYGEGREKPSQARVKEAEVPSESAPQEPHFQFLKISYADDLGRLSAAINSFRRRLDELQDHLHFIDNALNTRFDQTSASSSSSIYPKNSRFNQPALDQVTELVSCNPGTHSIADEAENNGNKDGGKDSVLKEMDSSTSSEIEHLCEAMYCRGLRKYILSHLSDLTHLRLQVPLALKRTPLPAKFVFDCIGRFFLQGSKAYTKDSSMIPSRQVSILILELFLLSDINQLGTDNQMQIEPSLKLETDLAATAWRRRIMSEGGFSRASDIDARGLLLFLACFGIPAAFTNDDIRNIIRTSNAKDISDALKRSPALLARIPDVIEGMIKNGMNVEAVDVACTFGLEDKFPPPTILSSFLQERSEVWKRARSKAQNSPTLQKEADEKQLASLKSLLKCLEDHKIDVAKILSEWQVNEQVAQLEKDIADVDKKRRKRAVVKRKADGIESSKRQKGQEVKQSQFVGKALPLVLDSAVGSREQKSAAYDSGVNNSSYCGSIPAHLSSSSMNGHRGAGSLPLAAGVEAAGTSTRTAGVPSAVYLQQLSGDAKRNRGGDNIERIVNSSGNGWHGGHGLKDDEVLPDKLFSRGGTSFVGCSGEFPGLPHGADSAGRSKALDLYHFADAVVEEDKEAYSGGSRIHNPSSLPPVPTHAHYHPSYLY